MIQQESIDFLRELAQNNNRDWFHRNKKRYEKELKNPWKAFIQKLIVAFQAYEPAIQIQPKDAIFRIARDVRFSKDKTPYQTHVSALISPGGRKAKEHPGFYIQLSTGVLALGGGAYFLESSTLQQVRERIAREPAYFRGLIEAENFVRHYEQIRGDQHKRIPKEFKEVHEQLPVIANKQYYYMAELPPEEILRDDIVDFVTSYYLAGKPLNDFLAEAI